MIVETPFHYDSKYLTSHMIVLGRLKLMPSMLGPDDERHRGATVGK